MPKLPLQNPNRYSRRLERMMMDFWSQLVLVLMGAASGIAVITVILTITDKPAHIRQIEDYLHLIELNKPDREVKQRTKRTQKAQSNKCGKEMKP